MSSLNKIGDDLALVDTKVYARKRKMHQCIRFQRRTVNKSTFFVSRETILFFSSHRLISFILILNKQTKKEAQIELLLLLFLLLFYI